MFTNKYSLLYKNTFLYIDICLNGHVRLAGGKDAIEGRVEICSNGVWGTIDHNHWDNHDATVACRQLGLYQPFSSILCLSRLNTIINKLSLYNYI